MDKIKKASLIPFRSITLKITAIGRLLEKLEQPRALNRLILVLVVVCAGLFIADFFLIRHGHFEWENFYGFYGIFGFCAFYFIVIAAKNLRRLIGRNENYYGESVVDTEDYPPDELDVADHNE